MLLFMICLFVAAAGIALILLARLVRSYPLAFLGLVVVIAAGVLAILAESRLILGVYWILFSLLSVVFAGLWLYKNKRWAFWWSFGADLALVASAIVSSLVLGKAELSALSYSESLEVSDKIDLLVEGGYIAESEVGSVSTFETWGKSANDAILSAQGELLPQVIIALLVPLAIFIACGIVFNFLFNFVVPKLQHKDKNERKHLTNIDPLIGKKVTIIKDAVDGRAPRGQLGDVDWAVGPFFAGESFKEGDVVVIKQIKGVTLLVVRDGKDYRKEMKEKRKAEAEAARKAREEAKAKKAAEKEKPVEEPKKEEPVVEPVKEELAPEPIKEEPKVEEPVQEEPKVEEPAPEPVVEEPAPVVEEPKKEKAEFVPFAVRLQSGDDFLKEAYNELKSEVLSYGIKSRVSSTGDKFRLHTKTYVKMVIAGKYLKLYIALDPKDYADSTYPFEDASRMGAHKDTPFVFKIKSGLSVRRAKVLIGDAAKKDNLVQGEVVKHDHISDIKVEEGE